MNKLDTNVETKSKKAGKILTAGVLLAGGIYGILNYGNEKGNYQGDFLCKYEDYNTIIKGNTQKILDMGISNISQNGLVKYELENNSKLNVLTVYFRTNSDTLYKNDYKDIEASLKNIPRETEILLEGFSDSRGEFEENLNLSSKRNNGIQNLLEKKGFTNIKLVNYGEGKNILDSKGTKDLALYEKLLLRKDRKVDIKINSSVIHSGLDKFPADKYLIDFSGSMDGYKENEVKKYKFKQDSEVFGFNSEMDENTCKNKLEKQKPDGDTPLWDSLYKLIENSSNNQIITILTDGEDTNSEKFFYDIIKLSKDKGIKLNFVSIGENDSILKEISKKTNGGFYFVN